MKATRGLTFIEGSLVVLLVVIVVGAILRPFFQGGEPIPKSTISLSNIKQLGLSTLLYAGDFDDRFPPAGRWMSVTYAYTKSDSAYVDPAFDGLKENRNSPRAAEPEVLAQLAKFPFMQRAGAWGYAFDTRLSGKETSKIANEANRIELYQSGNTAWNAHDPFLTFREMEKNHKTNIAFVDSHAKPILFADLHPQQEYIGKAPVKP